MDSEAFDLQELENRTVGQSFYTFLYFDNFFLNFSSFHCKYEQLKATLQKLISFRVDKKKLIKKKERSLYSNIIHTF